jgi:ferritin-like protein
MGQSSCTYTEPLESLSGETRDMHSALVSLQEELEAVGWYRQRADAHGGELRKILLHNMREDIEHACMLLEWLRRNNHDFQEHMQTYLFTEERITELEETETTEKSSYSEHSQPSHEKSGAGGGNTKPSLTIGSLKES